MHFSALSEKKNRNFKISFPPLLLCEINVIYQVPSTFALMNNFGTSLMKIKRYTGEVFRLNSSQLHEHCLDDLIYVFSSQFDLFLSFPSLQYQ